MDDAERMVGDYGIDSPVVVRGLGLAVAGALLVTVVSGIFDHVTVMAAAFGASILIALAGLVLVRSSRVHKLRERVRFVDRLELQGDERVLDVGCGRGLLLVEVAQRLDARGRAFGVDRWKTIDWKTIDGAVAEADIAIHNAHIEGVDLQVDITSADPRALPYADESFDAVISGLALHHIEGFESRVHAIREIARVVRPGGRVVLIDRHHTRTYMDALRACNLVDVRRSRRVWRLLPPARYVTGTMPMSIRRPERAPAPVHVTAPATVTTPASVATPASATTASAATPAPLAAIAAIGPMVTPEPTPILNLDGFPSLEPVLVQDAARTVAEQFLDEVVRPGLPDLDLVVSEIRELPTCWVVGWNTREYIESGSLSSALTGNGPIIVSKRSGFARLGIAALPVEDHLDAVPDEADEPPHDPVAGQLQLSDAVTGERDGAGHEAEDDPSV